MTDDSAWRLVRPFRGASKPRYIRYTDEEVRKLVESATAPMGSTLVKTDAEFKAAALLTFEGDFASASPEIEVPQVELIDTIDSIDFGFVDIDHGDDRYEQN